MGLLRRNEGRLRVMPDCWGTGMGRGCSKQAHLMKTRTFLLAFGFTFVVWQLKAAPLSFPAGTFEGGTASSWAPQTTGTATAGPATEGGNTFGRIAMTLVGSGSLSTSLTSPFEANSLYVVSLDVRSSSLASLASESFGVQVLDANNAVVAELNESGLVGLLGINLGVVSELTGELGGLAGKLDLIGALQPLLELLEGNQPLLQAVEDLLASLVGQDPSVVSKVVDLLEAVLNGTLDPSGLDPSEIASILGLLEASPIVTALDDLLTFAGGNEGPLEALVNLLDVILGSPGDLGVVQALLESLVGNDGLVQRVSDILLYALADDGLLGGLTDTLTRSLLGVADPNGSGFQNVKLIFSVGGTVPEGAIGIRLSAGAAVALGLEVDYDNVTVERFALVTPPTPGPGGAAQPFLKVRGKKVRKVNSNKVVIRGRAAAFGTNNQISRVEYKVRAKGVKNRKFRKAKGLEQWRIVLRPNEGRTRIRVRAFDALQQVSPIRRVVVVK